MLKRLPRSFAFFALGACSGMSGADAGTDAGCTLPSDFPPDASQFDRDTVCTCRPSMTFHCLVEGGPRCESWSCFPKKTSDGGFEPTSDGGVVCLC